MKTKTIFISLFLSLFFLHSFGQQIIIETNSEQTITEHIASIDHISFPKNNFVISRLDQSSRSLNLISIKKLYFDTTTAVNSINELTNTLEIYPNPASDFIQILNAPLDKTIFSIYSLHGIEVLQSSLNSSSDIIDISSLVTGVYFLRISNQTYKFIKL
ncbi:MULTISPECIES: T9SS type A sorting domain-containing protein [unclassified Lentimicrobium]|uniref:T9SS type A sorting domain-containing protein n=1 Tax=unclassified Lentimicrobium TaxID=2677434 RepID=UPI001551B8D7|nr:MULTISPECIES: T9SS type A sorting domain-containing protein [unclassified Lentimicrobium]NPD44041.1 T9SS type A sorting domain-containing protein [Lentimicrobium sp. S6]NPD85893.1 T9SS type A sorting domain-containing protein [Lentimicrobium sp. L6]